MLTNMAHGFAASGINMDEAQHLMLNRFATDEGQTLIRICNSGPYFTRVPLQLSVRFMYGTFGVVHI